MFCLLLYFRYYSFSWFSSYGLFGLVLLSMKSDDEKEVVELEGDKKKKRRGQSPNLLFVLFEKALFLRI